MSDTTNKKTCDLSNVIKIDKESTAKRKLRKEKDKPEDSVFDGFRVTAESLRRSEQSLRERLMSNDFSNTPYTIDDRFNVYTADTTG